MPLKDERDRLNAQERESESTFLKGRRRTGLRELVLVWKQERRERQTDRRREKSQKEKK